MATVTIFTTVDAFNNNISGFYDSETFLSAKTSSSSNAVENDTLMKFTTVGAGIAAGDTINSVTLYMYMQSWSDPADVNSLGVYTDINNVWGTLGPEDPPIASISFGTVVEGTMGANPAAWNSKALTVTIPKSGVFNVGISCDASDSFAGEAIWDSIENTNARSPYPAGSGQTDGRAFIVINYTPASAGKSYAYILGSVLITLVTMAVKVLSFLTWQIPRLFSNKSSILRLYPP